jgi:hypothetical protein
MIGPLIGGVVFQFLGATGAFAGVTVHYLLSEFMTLRIAASIEPGDKPERVLGIGEAFRLAVEDRDILRILLVTVVFNVWAFPFVSMIPVIGLERLNLSAGLGRRTGSPRRCRRPSRRAGSLGHRATRLLPAPLLLRNRGVSRVRIHGRMGHRRADNDRRRVLWDWVR